MDALCLDASGVRIEAKFWPDIKEANRRERKAAEDIDDVMLMSQKRGKTNQDEPEDDGGSRQTAKMLQVGVDQEK